MVAIVDREGCIGCTLCTGVCPEVFQMEDGLAQGGPVPTGLCSRALTPLVSTKFSLTM